MAFSKIKSHLRKVGARTIDALMVAVEHICELFKEGECYNYFEAIKIVRFYSRNELVLLYLCALNLISFWLFLCNLHVNMGEKT